MVQETRLYESTPTIDTNAYQANDVIGGLITLSSLNLPGNGGTIRKLKIRDNDNQKAVLTIYIFNQAPTSFLDDDTFAPVAADLDKLVAIINVAATDYVTINNRAIAIIDDLSSSFALNGDNHLYAYIVCTATPTYTNAANLKLSLIVWVD